MSSNRIENREVRKKYLADEVKLRKKAAVTPNKQPIHSRERRKLLETKKRAKIMKNEFPWLLSLLSLNLSKFHQFSTKFDVYQATR